MPRLPNCVLARRPFFGRAHGGSTDPGLRRAQATLQRLPLRFEANQGQWIPGVRYGAHAGGYTLLLGGSGPS